MVHFVVWCFHETLSLGTGQRHLVQDRLAVVEAGQAPGTCPPDTDGHHPGGRTGAEYIEAALAASGRRLVVMEPTEIKGRSRAGHDRGPDKLLRPAVRAALRQAAGGEGREGGL